jgi:hypothetical protein
MGDRGRQLPHRRDAISVCERHLGVEEPLFAGAQLLFRALAVGDIAAHIPDVQRLPGLRIVDPKGRIEDRNRISGLEMAVTHLSRPGTLL